MRQIDKEIVCILALIIGLAGIFYFFGIPAYSQYYNFKFQGQPDGFASEQPAPLIPQMSVFELLRVLVPCCIGIFASALYVILAFIYIFRKVIDTKFAYFIAGLDVFARLLFSLVTPIFHSFF